MGWKSVELQVAIPRTVDASNIQQQMSQQHQRFQESLAQHQLKEQLRKRKQVNEYVEARRLKYVKNNESSKHQLDNNDESTSQQEVKQLDHPYLGKRFDRMR